jgi:hypothetical protein
MYLLGQLKWIVIQFDSGSMKKYFHGIVSGEYVFQCRHALRNEECEEALVFVENSWQEGDEMYHHKMASHIISIYPILYKPILLKRSMPIALKYARFWNPNTSSEK